MSQALSPDAQAAFATACQHLLAGRWGAAERLYRHVLSAHPDHADSLHLLGVVADQTGRHDLAVELMRAAIGRDGEVALYHANLAAALRRLGLLHEAVDACRAALRLDPCLVEAICRLGDLLGALGQHEEAMECHRRALDLEPNLPVTQNSLGILLWTRGRLDEAVACFRHALNLRPGFLEAHCNLGSTLHQQGLLPEAIACFRAALGINPDFAEAHYPLAMALLTEGDMAEGWREYEWRSKTAAGLMSHRDAALPRWLGEAAAGRTLLIEAEGGLGDTLQFCRYAPLAAARGPRVILGVQRPLVRLLRGLPGVDLVLGEGDDPPLFDLYCPMLSLPFALGCSTLDSIPATTPYLHPDAARVAAWRRRLAATSGRGIRVGLVWAGDPRVHSPGLWSIDRRRSLAPERLAPLFDVPGVSFFSLQKVGPAAPAVFPLSDFMGEMDDFADTAGLVANLDLVISVDTAVAHLAGALARPVWLLDRFDSCWRWLRERRDSPWYPTLRLYRQPRAGDWDAVLAEVTRDLRGLARSVGGDGACWSESQRGISW